MKKKYAENTPDSNGTWGKQSPVLQSIEPCRCGIPKHVHMEERCTLFHYFLMLHSNTPYTRIYFLQLVDQELLLKVIRQFVFHGVLEQVCFPLVPLVYGFVAHLHSVLHHLHNYLDQGRIKHGA